MKRFHVLIAILALILLTSPLTWAQSTTDGRSATLAVSDTVVDAEGTYIKYLRTPYLNDAGQVLIVAPLRDVNDDSVGTSLFITSETDDNLTMIAASGQDLGDGNTLKRIYRYPSFNNAGEVAFIGSLNDDSDDRALFLGSSQGLTRLARVGDTIAHEDPNEVGGTLGQRPSGYGYHLMGNVRLNDAGQVSFTAGIKDADDNARLGAFRASTSGLTQIAREYQSIPGDNARLFWSSFRTGGGATGKINSAGLVLFKAGIDETNGPQYPNGLFLNSGDQVVRRMDAGSVIPGSSETFRQFSELYLDNSGGFHFYSVINDASDVEVGTAYFYASGSEITELARTGQPLADGNTLDISRMQRPHPHHNESGQVAFFSRNRDPEGNSIGGSLFVAGANGLVEIARRGDAAPDGNGKFGISQVAHERIIGLNDAGVVAFRDTLYDTAISYRAHEGIFLSDGIDTVTVVRDRDVIEGRSMRSLNDAPNLGGLNNFGQVIYEAEWGDAVINIFTPDLHYRADVDGSFDEGVNWTLSLNPGAPHDVFLAADTNITVTAGAGSRTINSIEIGGGEGLATLHLGQGSTINVTEQVTVLEGGALRGGGVIAGDVINDGGSLAPGASPGTLKIEGDLNISGNSGLEIELGGTVQGENYDLLSQDDGTQGISLGGILTIKFIDGFASSITSDDSFTVLTSDAPLNGAFTNVASGQRLSTSGDLGSFLVTYGDGSTTPSQVVLSDFEATPVLSMTFSEWIVAEGLPPGSRGALDDPDGNGVSNLLHYFFGNPEGRSSIHELQRDGSDLTWSFAVPKHVTGVTVTSQTSDNLSPNNWHPGPAPTLTSTNATHHIYTVTVTSTEDTLFMQLQIQLD